MNLPFAVPDVGEEEAQAVAEVVRKGWLTSGQVMKDFEDDIAREVEARHVVSVNSATAGLHLALMALGIGRGDKVIVPTLTFAATAEVVYAVGAEIVLADVEPDTLNVSVATLDKAWVDGCKAVIPVHFAGLPCDMHPILAWAKQKNLKVIEDAAHAFGAMYGVSPVGSLDSDATVFSFYATKCITTGEGGAVAVREGSVAREMKMLRLHGISRDVFDRYTNVGSKWEYDVLAPGWKYNLTDVAAAIGRVQIRKAEAMKDQRTRLAYQYYNSPRMRKLKAQRMVPGHAHHLYPIWGVPDRDGFIERMAHFGVGCSVHFKPLHRLTAYKDDPSKYPVADAYWQTCVSLPLYSKMNHGHAEQVIRAVGVCL